MDKFTDETRRRLATGWDPRVCTLREYARQNGISERAIRNWRAQVRVEEGSAVPAGNAAVPPQATLDALQARLADLEAAADALLTNIAAVRAVLDAAAAACRAVPAGTDAPGGELGGTVTPAQPAPVGPMPMPAPGFVWL